MTNTMIITPDRDKMLALENDDVFQEVADWARSLGLNSGRIPRNQPIVIDLDARTVSTRYTVLAENADPDAEFPAGVYNEAAGVMETEPFAAPYTAQTFPEIPELLRKGMTVEKTETPDNQ